MRLWIPLLLAGIGLGLAPGAGAEEAPAFSKSEHFASLALGCVHREYPNKIAHVMAGDADLRPPRELTPVFFGCYDWHSSVHGHWLLLRFLGSGPAESPLREQARAALSKSLTPAQVAAEVAYLQGEGRVSFERPYGLAWLLQLAAELRRSEEPMARDWLAALAPLEAQVATRIKDWLPKLAYPIRIGEHAQTAFAFGLIHDWSVIAGDIEMQGLLETRSRHYYLGDVDCPMAYEPSGQDFLSPCLAEADLMRRVLGQAEYARWLSHFLPGIPTDLKQPWLEPAVVTDRKDPKLAHLDGLNLSRAWMLRGMAIALSGKDPRRPSLLEAADQHTQAALPAVTGEHYEGGHWLGSFALYLVSGAGESADLAARPAADAP